MHQLIDVSGLNLDLGIKLCDAAPLVAANVPPEAIKEFRGHRPDLRIQLHDCETASIVPTVESGDIDIGLRVMFKRARGLRLVPLFRFCFIVVRADTDPGFHRTSTTWSALKGEHLISLVPSNPPQQLINQHLEQAGLAAHTNGVINYVDTLLALAEAGEGSAVVPPGLWLPAAIEK